MLGPETQKVGWRWRLFPSGKFLNKPHSLGLNDVSCTTWVVRRDEEGCTQEWDMPDVDASKVGREGRLQR